MASFFRVALELLQLGDLRQFLGIFPIGLLLAPQWAWDVAAMFESCPILGGLALRALRPFCRRSWRRGVLNSWPPTAMGRA